MKMKKKLLSFAAIILTSGILVFTGCKKDDATPPVVTLNGAESVTVILNSSYTELGATATDDKDGTITPVTSGSVNTDLVGKYTITYSATDAAGNEGTATRTVTVRNEADIYAGEYTTTADSVYTQTITASPTKNKAIVFSMFARRSNNNKISAILVGGTAFQLDGAQQGVNVGKNGCTFNYTSLGAGQPIVKSTNGKYSFSIKYTEARVQGGTNCPASGAASFEDVSVQK
jgi:hypothetical protein